MSYILDALKKAEHERAIGQVPGIGSAHEPALSHAPRRWLWVLLVVLVLNVLLLAVLLWPDRGRSPDSQPVAETAVPPAAAPVPEPYRPAPVSAQATSVPAGVSERMPAGRPVEAAVPPPPVSLRPLPPLPEPAAPDVVETSANVTAGAVQGASARPHATAGNDNNNLPVWPQISGRLLSELNDSLHLDVHVYADDPGERFVLINMRKYHIGQRLQEGPVVDDITPDSVILSFHGQRFRMLSQ